MCGSSCSAADDLERRRHKRVRKRREERRREKTTPTSQKPILSNGMSSLPLSLLQIITISHKMYTCTVDAFPLPTSLHQPLSPERIHDLLPQLTSPPTPPHTHPRLDPDAREFVPQQAMCTVEDVETRAMCTVEDEETSGDLNDTSPSQPSFAEALRGKPLPIWPRTPSRTAGGKGERLPVHHIVRNLRVKTTRILWYCCLPRHFFCKFLCRVCVVGSSPHFQQVSPQNAIFFVNSQKKNPPQKCHTIIIIVAPSRGRGGREGGGRGGNCALFQRGLY